MGKRDLAENSKPQKYFEEVPTSSEQEDEGKRDIGPLYPFLISGGENTERWYFVHINDTTQYKFNIEPKYFGEESNYTEVFPKRIKWILEHNAGAKIFCIFDWDSIYKSKKEQIKYCDFKEQFKNEIANGIVVLCPSMPCIEYWFLLHFCDDKSLYKSYSKISNPLAPYIKPCFPNPNIALKKLLKKEENLENPIWVMNLCADGKLDDAIKRAENNIKIAIENGNLNDQSYTYIYKIFK
ncbi:MAG: RloB domain-containing protein [Paludibacteraceae bacterium]|nr:RloB domain-containing protein [Paludibacteraceae bacterium]